MCAVAGKIWLPKRWRIGTIKPSLVKVRMLGIIHQKSMLCFSLDKILKLYEALGVTFVEKMCMRTLYLRVIFTKLEPKERVIKM